MDTTVDPSVDFYRFSAGTWMRRNPVPSDKSRWGGFGELREHNFRLLRSILEDAAALRRAPPGSPTRQVGDFYRSAMDRARRQRLGLRPVEADLRRIAAVRDLAEWGRELAASHGIGGDALFAPFVAPDRKESSRYVLYAMQGGLTMPDRDYYLAPGFARVRAAYRAHVARLLTIAGTPPRTARRDAATILGLETELARASRSQVDLRDPLRNYHALSLPQLERLAPAFPWRAYLRSRGIGRVDRIVVGQPEFFRRIARSLVRRPLAEWATYLRWKTLSAAAPYLDRRSERADFAFTHRVLLGQRSEEPDWKRAALQIDRSIGEALGRLYVERHFPPEARRRVLELVERLKTVFRARLEHLQWMAPPTRRRAVAKFDRFTTKIGHPDRFRDYSGVRISPTDYLGNVRRAAAFEEHRRIVRIGKRVDRGEWEMTPPEVNAYFNPSLNEIVFPAGILQPPFFDAGLDEAVNYGAIGAVIGHEITHGYDDQGRKFDAEGNLKDWWRPRDAREFDRRAGRIIAQFGRYEALPGAFVNGALTAGENIADLGGLSIAFEALRQHLEAHPEERRPIDGLTPEQRFFVAFGQVWRENIRPADLRRRLTVDPHAPGRFRVLGPLSNLSEFAEAFGVPPGAPMRQTPARRVEIW